jgi:hypothetical protein
VELSAHARFRSCLFAIWRSRIAQAPYRLPAGRQTSQRHSMAAAPAAESANVYTAASRHSWTPEQSLPHPESGHFRLAHGWLGCEVYGPAIVEELKTMRRLCRYDSCLVKPARCSVIPEELPLPLRWRDPEFQRSCF